MHFGCRYSHMSENCHRGWLPDWAVPSQGDARGSWKWGSTELVRSPLIRSIVWPEPKMVWNKDLLELMAGNRENPEENRKHQEVEVKLKFGHAPRLSQDWSLHRHQFQRLTRTKLRILWPWIENFEGSEKTWLWREWAQKEELGKKTRNLMWKQCTEQKGPMENE